MFIDDETQFFLFKAIFLKILHFKFAVSPTLKFSNFRLRQDTDFKFS